MSVVCHHALQKAIKEFNLTEPGQILTKTRQIVIESLNATNQNIKDGMDCSLIVMNHATKRSPGRALTIISGFWRIKNWWR